MSKWNFQRGSLKNPTNKLLWSNFKKKLDGQRLSKKKTKDTIPALSVSSVQGALMKKLNLIQNQPLLCQIFKEPPTISYKKGKLWQRTCLRGKILNVNTRFHAGIYTAISRKVVAKTLHATIPKGNMGYDQYTCSWHCSCRTYLCCFPLALANICPWPIVPFFEISLKNRELKNTHNTFRDCRVNFLGQPFSKQLYMCHLCSFVVFNITNLGIEKPILGVFFSIKPLSITSFCCAL